MQKPSETSSGPYTSPPPIGYPTRDAVVGDPPAAAVETNSKGVNPEAIMSCFRYVYIYIYIYVYNLALIIQDVIFLYIRRSTFFFY